MIDISERRILQEFPNFRTKLRFAALQPLFQLRITASVLEYHELSVIARFMLRLVHRRGNRCMVSGTRGGLCRST